MKKNRRSFLKTAAGSLAAPTYYSFLSIWGANDRITHGFHWYGVMASRGLLGNFWDRTLRCLLFVT